MKNSILIYQKIQESLKNGIPVALITAMNSEQNNLGRKFFINKNKEVVGDINNDSRVNDLLLEYVIKKMNQNVFSVISIVSLNYDTYKITESNKINISDNFDKNNGSVLFIEFMYPKMQLIIVGGGHVGHALAQLGDVVGFEITVVDDRKDYANLERFPMAIKILTGDIESSIDSLELNALSYVVLVSRGHKLDEAALRMSVQKNPAYIGMIGSKRRTSIVINNLVQEGVNLEKIQNIYTPIGIDLGGQSPAEIALSILSEIIIIIHKGSGKHLNSLKKIIL
ncbi:MAG: xanthine dehydrogenase accessory factor [Chloroflexi bacterium]|nr:MAG: xanthine dehydrogenase accessory factor [Chloroflexota bacterium]